ncbi:translation initiation factor 2 [Pseudomonas sp. MH9.2]|uniref:translation initiation factor 2 n=1 Tax=unclassified Pseudomonas TaxID=196821 RepID=UPI002AC93B21|nr:MULTISPECIES: translation initiation factor 2 [unclassified Pseudomonas]MEB0028453.1 translation initiation factor 2 [Pseudomonas sp. MH9.2]MEE3508021.1 translation initiation factor 2 [Pseudomonas sp. 10C3]WPX69692.1 translation initiation factor 2 [Pseudomonas sp. MH9.2]
MLPFMSMNFLRCIGLLLIVLASACGPEKPAAPVPKVVSGAASGIPVGAVGESVVVPPAPIAPQVHIHELKPNIPVVPVVVTSSARASVQKTVSSKATSESPPAKPRAPMSSKTKPASEVVRQTRLSQPNLDLSLPTDMVKEMAPVGTVAPIVNKSLLPPMFGEKKTAPEGPFQLNGRLLNNAMKLQMRDENRREVEGAALDFEFKQ